MGGQGWKAVMELPRWQQSQGRDFFIYESHPGFVEGDAAHVYRSMPCEEMRGATQFLMDLPMRALCKTKWDMRNLLVTPYVPNFVDFKNLSSTFDRPTVPLAQRKSLIFFSGRCTPSRFEGKLFRCARRPSCCIAP